MDILVIDHSFGLDKSFSDCPFDFQFLWFLVVSFCMTWLCFSRLMHLVTAVGVAIFLWEYWKARNDYIFQDVPIFQNAIISKVCSSAFLVLNSSKIASRRLITPPSELRDTVIG